MKYLECKCCCFLAVIADQASANDLVCPQCMSSGCDHATEKGIFEDIGQDQFIGIISPVAEIERLKLHIGAAVVALEDAAYGGYVESIAGAYGILSPLLFESFLITYRHLGEPTAEASRALLQAMNDLDYSITQVIPGVFRVEGELTKVRKIFEDDPHWVVTPRRGINAVDRNDSEG